MQRDNLDNELLEGFLQQQDHKPAYKHMPSLDDIKQTYSNTDMDTLLQSMQDGKILNIKQVITDIEDLIAERRVLQKEVFADVDKIMMNMNNFMAQAGDKIETTKEAELKEKLIDIEAFKLNEKINAFRDIAALKKELRDRMQEYREQEQNAHMIDDLLGEK